MMKTFSPLKSICSASHLEYVEQVILLMRSVREVRGGRVLTFLFRTALGRPMTFRGG